MASGTSAADAKMIWLREEPSARNPSHTRQQIAAAALELADAEGFEAVSMRRLAQRLGAGTMTLYHYIRNKDELVTLMADAVIAETLVPEDELAVDDWREAMRQIATRTRETFRRHRWALDRLDYAHPGPNALRGFEQELRACAGLEIPVEERFELVTFVNDYVYGFALREAREIEEQERGWEPEVLEFLQLQLDSEDFPEFRHLLGDDIEAGFAWAGELFLGEGRFERGLERLLDGIQAALDGGRSPRGARRR
ncbi:MAG: TetR/AcrR family transcriptional regulator [Solirubrobacterales bacterium]